MVLHWQNHTLKIFIGERCVWILKIKAPLSLTVHSSPWKLFLIKVHSLACSGALMPFAQMMQPKMFVGFNSWECQFTKVFSSTFSSKALVQEIAPPLTQDSMGPILQLVQVSLLVSDWCSCHFLNCVNMPASMHERKLFQICHRLFINISTKLILTYFFASSTVCFFFHNSSDVVLYWHTVGGAGETVERLEVATSVIYYSISLTCSEMNNSR